MWDNFSLPARFNIPMYQNDPITDAKAIDRMQVRPLRRSTSRVRGLVYRDREWTEILYANPLESD